MALGRRQKLHEMLVEAIGEAGKVHFLPTTNFVLQYPCVVYILDDVETQHADNRPYTLHDRYQVTYMHTDPDDPIVHDLAMLPKTAFDRQYRTDNVIHDVFNIFI